MLLDQRMQRSGVFGLVLTCEIVCTKSREVRDTLQGNCKNDMLRPCAKDSLHTDGEKRIAKSGIV